MLIQGVQALISYRPRLVVLPKKENSGDCCRTEFSSLCLPFADAPDCFGVNFFLAYRGGPFPGSFCLELENLAPLV